MSNNTYTEKEKQYIRQAYYRENKKALNSNEFDELSKTELNRLLNSGKKIRQASNRKVIIGWVVVVLVALGVSIPLYVRSSEQTSSQNKVISTIQHPNACQLASEVVDYNVNNPLTIPPSFKIYVVSSKNGKDSSTCSLDLVNGTDKYFSLITINYNYSKQRNQEPTSAQKSGSDTSSQYYYISSFSNGFYDGTVQTGPLSTAPANDLSSSLTTIIAFTIYSELPSNPGITPAK